MNKLLTVAAAVSALALSSSAFAANTSYDLTISGDIAAFCNITDGTSGSDAFTVFDNSTGGVTGSTQTKNLTVATNSSCSYTLTPTHGALVGKNQAVPDSVAYSAAFSLGGAPIPAAYVSAATLKTTPGTISATAGNQTVTVGYATADQAGPFKVDTYQDILTIAVAAQ
jgi:hypothetical protein